jgi:hypothetical protein
MPATTSEDDDMPATTGEDDDLPAETGASTVTPSQVVPRRSAEQAVGMWRARLLGQIAAQPLQGLWQRVVRGASR